MGEGLSGCKLQDLAVACTWDLAVASAQDLVVACWDLATQLIALYLPLLSNVFPPHLILCPTALVALENAKPTPTSFNI